MGITEKLSKVRTWIWVGLSFLVIKVASYAIENSKLPEWMSSGLTWVVASASVASDWLRSLCDAFMQATVSLWVLVTVVVCCVLLAVICGVMVYQLRKVKATNMTVPALHQQIVDLSAVSVNTEKLIEQQKTRCAELETLYANAKASLDKAKKERDSLARPLSDPTVSKSQQDYDERVLSAVVGPTFASAARAIGKNRPSMLGVTAASLMTIQQQIDNRDAELLDVIRVCTKAGGTVRAAEIGQYVKIKSDVLHKALASLSSRGYIETTVVGVRGDSDYRLSPSGRLHFKKIEQGEVSQL